MTALHIPGSRIASCIALAGLIPFIVLAVCLWFVSPSWQPLFADILKYYAIVSLAFAGGAHWGTAAAGPDEPQTAWRYAYGVWPKILALVAAFCPADTAYFLLAGGFLAALMVDRDVYAGTLWYVRVRAAVTMTACITLYIAYRALQQ